MKQLKKISGVVPAIATPLTDDDRVDIGGLRRVARYLLDGGVHAILANGSMGGFAWLTADEQVRAVATVVEETNGKIPVIGGIGECGSSRAVDMARRMSATGVDCLSILPPFYFLANQKQLEAYFREIADAVDLPVFLYDNPVLTKNPIHPATVAEVRRRCPNVAGIKVSNSDVIHLQEVIHVMRGEADFSILSGSEFLMQVVLEMGCQGVVGGLFNLCPRMAVECYEAVVAGERNRARELQRYLIETWQVFRRGAIWGAFDEALRYLELCDRATGRPYVTELTVEERAEVHAILDQYVKPYRAAPAGLG